MNRVRRKAIADAVKLIYQAEAAILEAKEILETVKDEEQEAFDNMPEGLQETEKGETMGQNVEDLEEIIDYLEEFDITDYTTTLEEM